MLKWLGKGKPDHPMADLKEARKLLSELPQQDSFKALEEVTGWIDSVAHTEGFRVDDQIALFKLLDEAAQPHQRRLARDYLANPRLPRFQENRLWSAIYGFWSQLAAAYAQAIEALRGGAKGTDSKDFLSLAVCRGLRAYSGRLKWLQMRYGPIDPEIWKKLGGLYRFAEAKGLARRPVALYPGVPGETTAEGELLKILVLWASAPDGLVPLSLEIAERIAAHFSPLFALSPVAAGATHGFDLQGDLPPGRALGGSTRQGWVYFNAQQAASALEALVARLKKGEVPSEVNLGGTYDPGAVLEACEHLARYWSATPPERQHERHPVVARVSVTHGFQSLLETLDGGSGFFCLEAESWTVENISAGGFGAVIPGARSDWLQVGVLLGVQPEGVQSWGVGIIRRYYRSGDSRGHVGVETLARTATTVSLRPTRPPGAAESLEDAQPAVLLKDGRTGGEARLLLKAGSYSPSQSLEMEAGGRKYLLIPLALLEKGQDFDLARFREMERSEGEEA